MPKMNLRVYNKKLTAKISERLSAKAAWTTLEVEAIVAECVYLVLLELRDTPPNTLVNPKY